MGFDQCVFLNLHWSNSQLGFSIYLRWHGHQPETTSWCTEIWNFIGPSIFGSNLSCHSMVTQWLLYAYMITHAPHRECLPTFTPKKGPKVGKYSIHRVSSLLNHLSSDFFLAKVAYGGVFPSNDWRGKPFSGSRASLAGKHISGGPYTLTEVRLGQRVYKFNQ